MALNGALRCSYRNATMIVCTLNLIAFLYVLHSLLAPRYLTGVRIRHPPAHKYSEVELRRIRDSVEARRAVEPHALISRVREIQEEANLEAAKDKQIGDARQKAAKVLAQRLKELKEVNNQMNQQALEEWRKKRLDSARKREAASKGGKG